MSKKFEYIDVEKFSGLPSIEVNDVIGLVRLAEANHVKFVFRLGVLKKEDKPSDFFFPLHNVAYSIKAHEFIFLEDYYHAIEKKFPTATEYYDAAAAGFDLYEEYKHHKSTGDGKGNREDFDIAKAKGYVKNFEVFVKKNEKYKTIPRTLIPEDKTESPISICEFALSKGFENYQEFEKAYDLGYPEKTIYVEATSKGFKSSNDYFDAVTKGFTLPSDYELACEKRMANKKELDDYRLLKSGNYKNLCFDQHHLIMLLREYDNGKKFVIGELFEILGKEQERYKRTFQGSDMQTHLPLWYSRGIDTEQKLIDYLKTSEDIKKIGTYSEQMKQFEIFRLIKTKVYVDASNVAYNSRTDKTRAPLYKNIRMLVQELAIWKFTDIVVIADASLRHHVKDDKDELHQIKRLAEYYESPSKTQADEFLLKAVRRNKCVIVSNDTFSDWQKKDEWLRKNIDNLRIPFLIEANGHVSMPALERVLKENEKL